MNDIQIFTNASFGQVRVILIKNQPWFVGKDIAEILGYSNPQKAVRDHVDTDDKGMNEIDTPGGKQNMATINESGLYSLILGSKLPTAKKFKHWVTSEVLPQINHTGGYIPSNENDSDEDIMAKALLIAHRKIKLNNKTIAEKERQLQDQKPKVLFADSVAVARTSILVGDLAKLIKQNGHDIGAKRLFTWMRENGYLIKRKGTDYNTPTQKSMKLKLLETKETTINHSDGHISISRTPKVTGKGQIYFINKFKDLFNKEEVI